MKKLLLGLGLVLLTGLAGCPGDAAHNAANVNVRNTNAANRAANTSASPVATSTPSVSNANSMSNNRPDVTFEKNKVRLTPTPAATTPLPTQTPQPPVEQKKEEGLFSFPPPKATDVTEIEAGVLLSSSGQTMLAEISEKLAAGLENAGYDKNYYSYFWNEKDEFAIVTAMERVNPDGSKFTRNRWVENDNLPTASWREYFRYLISGKKVYYRVFAFIVTARRTRQNFKNGNPPEFVTALNWEDKGESELGDGAATTVESAVWTERHKCFALVYLFVNHTSLDAPKSVDSQSKDVRRLHEDLVKEADAHLKMTNLSFGG